MIANEFCLQFLFTESVTQFSIPAIRITRVGQQIADILPWDDEAALREAAKSVIANVGISLMRITQRDIDPVTKKELVSGVYVEVLRTVEVSPS
jgi:hypothetical protein